MLPQLKRDIALSDIRMPSCASRMNWRNARPQIEAGVGPSLGRKHSFLGYHARCALGDPEVQCASQPVAQQPFTQPPQQSRCVGRDAPVSASAHRPCGSPGPVGGIAGDRWSEALLWRSLPRAWWPLASASTADACPQCGTRASHTPRQAPAHGPERAAPLPHTSLVGDFTRESPIAAESSQSKNGREKVLSRAPAL
jgi:hypothetical protein